MSFSPEQAERICNYLQRDRKTLRQIAELEGISASLIIWNASHDAEFAKQYARAIQIRTDIDFEEFISDIEDAKPEKTQFGVDAASVNWLKYQFDARKWVLSKRNPKKYGEKVEHTGEVTLKTVLLTPALKAENTRPLLAPAFEEGELIEGDGVE